MSKVIHFGVEVDDTKDYVENEKEFYSQAHQDLFVLGINKYVQEGTWVDIGCAGPRQHSNTFLLEAVNWTGLNFDIKDYKTYWTRHRKTEFTHCDATKINYKEEFKKVFKTKTINYLSLDIDSVSNIVLQKLPFDEYKFNVITIEHDLYAGSSPYKQKGYTNEKVENEDPYFVKQQQHKILTSYGYVCIAENVFVFEKNIMCPFEDWWVSQDIYEQIGLINFSNTFSDEILNKLGFVANRNCILEKGLKCIEELRSYATQCLDTTTPYINLKDKPQIIFIKDDWINLFVTKVLPHIFFPFTVLTNKIIDENNNLELLNNHFLQKWYSVDCNLQHPKIKKLPNTDTISNYLAAIKIK